MQGKPALQKIIAIDLLRALAALAVFSYHSRLGSGLAIYTGISYFALPDALGATYAVPLFFLISGYCIHASNIKYLKANRPLPLKEYYRRRFLRIYPPYFVALVFAVAVNYFITNDQLTVLDGVVHFFSLQGFTIPYFNTINLVLWTISVELAFYAIYPVFYYIRFKYNLNCALAFTFIISCLAIAYFTLKGDYSVPERFCVFNLWFAWCVGAYLADKKMLSTTNFSKPMYPVLYLVILCCLVYLNYTNSALSIIRDQLDILVWTAPMIFLLSKEDWLRRRQHTWIIRIFAAIGLSSYSLYLLHEPLIALKNFLVHKFFPVSFQLTGVALGILVIPVVAWYSYYYIEKPFIHQKSR